MAHSTVPAETGNGVQRRLWTVGIALVVAVPAYFLLAAFLPRWWAQTMGNVVAQRFTIGILVGLFVGFVFVVLPLTVLRLGMRRNASWFSRGMVALLAIVLAVPNLLTLIVVLGTGNAAHAGERIMDVEAPAFRGASAVGAILALAVLLGAQYLVTSRRHAQRRARAS